MITNNYSNYKKGFDDLVNNINKYTGGYIKTLKAYVKRIAGADSTDIVIYVVIGVLTTAVLVFVVLSVFEPILQHVKQSIKCKSKALAGAHGKPVVKAKAEKSCPRTKKEQPCTNVPDTSDNNLPKKCSKPKDIEDESKKSSSTKPHQNDDNNVPTPSYSKAKKEHKYEPEQINISDEYDLDVHNDSSAINDEVNDDYHNPLRIYDDHDDSVIKHYDYKMQQSEVTAEYLDSLSFLFKLDSSVSHVLVAVRRDANDNVASMSCMRICKETMTTSYMKAYIQKLPEYIIKANFKYTDGKFMFCNTKERAVYTRMLLKYLFAVSGDLTNINLIIHDSAGIDKRIIYDLVVQYSNRATSSIVSNGVIVEVTLHVVENKVYKIVRALNLAFMLNSSVEEICTIHNVPEDILYFESSCEHSNDPLLRGEFMLKYLFTIASAMLSEKMGLLE